MSWLGIITLSHRPIEICDLYRMKSRSIAYFSSGIGGRHVSYLRRYIGFEEIEMMRSLCVVHVVRLM